MEFSIPSIDVHAYDKQCVEELFADLVKRLSINGVDAYVTDVLKDEGLGVEAIQIRACSAQADTSLTSENIGFVPAELVYVFLNQYIMEKIV